MSFLLSEEQNLLSNSMQRMIEREVQPVLDAHPGEEPLPQDAMRTISKACAAQGLTSARLPESAGGPGMRMVDYGLLLRSTVVMVIFALLSQEVTAARVFAESADAIRERYLQVMVDVDVITVHGNHGTQRRLRPTQRGNACHSRRRALDRERREERISNASIAEVANVTVSVGKDDRGLSKLMRSLIDKSESLFGAREIPTLGLRQGHLGEMVFNDCSVPQENVMGQAAMQRVSSR